MSKEVRFFRGYLLIFFVLFISFFISLSFSVVNYLFKAYDYVHSAFYTSYIIFSTLNIFFSHFLLIIAMSIVSIFIFNLYTDSVYKKLLIRLITFSVLCFLINILASEIILPLSSTKLNNIIDKSLLAEEFIKTASKYHNEENYEISLLYYNRYYNLVEKDEAVSDKIRTIRSKLFTSSDKVSSVDDTLFPDEVTYEELADFYFDKEDYVSAWYYYQYLLEKDSSDYSRINGRINKIKNILKYRSSSGNEEDNLEWLIKKDRDLKLMYKYKIDAVNYMKSGDFKKAFFNLKNILSMNNLLREEEKLLEEALKQMQLAGINYTDIKDSEKYPGKDNFIFFNSDNSVVFARRIVRSFDFNRNSYLYYLHDIKVVFFDKNFKEKIVVSADYGEVKDNMFISFYSFSETNPNIEYLPIITKIDNITFYDKVLNIVSAEEKNFLLKYYKNDGNYFTFDNLDGNEEVKITISKMLYEKRYNFFDKSDNMYPYILPLNTNINLIYNFPRTFDDAFNLSVFNLIRLSNVDDKTLISFRNVIKSVIAYKISYVFMFFIFLLVVISFGWDNRTKSNLYFPFGLFILPFISFLIYSIKYFFLELSKSFYSLLSESLTLSYLLTIVFFISIVALVISIIYLGKRRNV